VQWLYLVLLPLGCYEEVMRYEPITELRGPRIHLKPLCEKDILELAHSLFSPTTWAVTVRGNDTPEKVRVYLDAFVAKDARGEGQSLVARLNASGEIVAFSTFHNATPNFSRVEIGFTWVADKWMRTFVNTEKKFLMISHAFEKMKVKRVEFSVDPRNEKSNRAMKRIGAQFEGTLRKWRFISGDDPGHRNIYSIIDDEWPQVREGFLHRLASSVGGVSSGTLEPFTD
jgi:N-acetyltransferase